MCEIEWPYLGGGASLMRRIPSKESLRGPNAMAKFRRSVSAVKASNRFARMVSEHERGGGGGRGGSSGGGRGGKGGGSGGDKGTWSLKSLRQGAGVLACTRTLHSTRLESRLES